MKVRYLISCVFIVSSCQDPEVSRLADAWDARNDPVLFSNDYIRTLDRLPKKAALDVMPWPDHYWPTYRGGITNVWRPPYEERVLTSLDEARALSVQELSGLSPAQKYDLFKGDYSFSLTQMEKRRTSPDAQTWEGLCHGWAAASLNFPQPKAVAVESSEGLQIPFGSSDIKALLSLYQGNIAYTQGRFLGGRCHAKFVDFAEARNWDSCKDTHAGAFHIVLTNEIGLKKSGFIADITPDYEVWNQPIYSYEWKVLETLPPSPTNAPGTVKQLKIQTVMNYVVESSPSWYSAPDDRVPLGEELYEYTLELDSKGAIIGGEWISERRPDFLWSQEKATFEGSFYELETILQASLNTQTEMEDPLMPSKPEEVPLPDGPVPPENTVIVDNAPHPIP